MMTRRNHVFVLDKLHQSNSQVSFSMNTVSAPHILVSLPRSTTIGFASLLQHGSFFPVDRPTPLLPFILSLPGFTREYIENTIQTIFVDGVATDSLDTILYDGSVVALSAAMPGLAGAIFRRQGIHSILRSKPADDIVANQDGPGFVTVKMFNSIATDRVDELLRHGIFVDGAAFSAFALTRSYLFNPPVTLSFSGTNVDFSQLLALVARDQVMKLQTLPLEGV
jgi:hypothetical protein